MGIVFRQSVKTSIVTFTGAFLGAMFTWLSANYFTKQQFGFSKTFTNWAVFASSLLFFGMGNVLVVFIHRYQDDDRRRKLLLTLCAGVPIVANILGSILYFIFREWILTHFQAEDKPLMDQFFIWMPIFIMLFMVVIVLELYLGTQMKVAVSAFMKDVVIRLLGITLILFFAWKMIDFSTFVIGNILIYVVPIFVLFILSMRTKGFGFSMRFRDFSLSEYKEMVHFSWYHFLLVISIMLMSTMDMLMLPFYDKAGVSSVAAYSVAVFIITFLQIPYKSMYAATFTVLAQAFTNNDIPKARDIFTRSSVNILIATVAITLLIFCNMDSAVAIFKDGYSDIIPIFSILLLGRLADLSTGMNDAVLTITNYYKFNVYISSVLILVLYALIRVFVPVYGIYGAAWSSTVTLVLFNIAKYIFVWKKLRMQPYSKRTLRVVAAGLPPLVIGYWLPHFFNHIHHMYLGAMLDVALRSTVIIAAYIGMLVWLKPSADLEEYIGMIRRDKRLF